MGKLSGKRRGAGDERLSEVKRIPRLVSCQGVGRFAMRLPQEALGRGANRVTASDLAERAERADILAGMQVRSPLDRSIANTRRNLVVVKNFNREEVDFTGERQADNKCVRPVSVSRFAKPSQVDCSLWMTRTFCVRVAFTLYLSLYYQKTREMGNAECALVMEGCTSPTVGCIRKPFIQACLIWLLLAKSHLTRLAGKTCSHR